MIAFRKFQPGGSIFGAYWVGLTYFDTFIHDPRFWNVFKNTILLGGLNLIFSFPMPILFALLLNELRSKKFKKIVQSISYLPHFMSVVIVVGMIFQLSSLKGTINQLVTPITGNAINFMQLCVLSARRWAMTSTEHDPDWWIATLVAAVRSGWHPAGHVAALHRTQSNHSGTSCISRGRLVVAHGQVGHLQPTPAG